MRTIICFLAFVAAGFAAAVHDHQAHTFQADETYLQRQQQILKFFVRVTQPNVFQDINDVGNSYNIEEHVADYKNPQDVKRFLYLYRNGELFPRDKVFSPFYYYGLHQAKLLFDIFYYAKDFDTFYKTAAWARNHVNGGIFVYAFTNAVYAREDTRYIRIPPPYEIYPQLFVNQEVIQQAVNYYQSGARNADGKPYIINANYTGYGQYKNYLRDPEQVLSYFTEDVGLNAFNAYFFLQYPSWFNSSQYGVHVDRRGEIFLYYVNQILSRYFFERLSNNLGDIGYLSDEEYLPEFYPGLRYSNGQEVPARPENLKLQDTLNVDVHYLEELYERVRSAIDFGFVYGKDGSKVSLYSEQGINVLGELIYTIGDDNPNFQAYGSFYNYLVYVAGKVSDPENALGLAPSALLQFSTQLRDPAYYQILHTIYDGFVYKYRKNLPRLTYQDLEFPGVQVNNFEVDKLVTYFDDFYVSLNQVVGVQSQEDLLKVDVRARQQRLNHRPYTYRVTVTSDKEVNALVRVLLVPTYDSYGRQYDFEIRDHYSVEIDRFPYHLTAGQNVIDRNSEQSTVAVHDPANFRTIYKRTQDALEGKVPLTVDKYERPYGFPHRLLIPRGNRAGLPVRVVVYVEPYTPVDNKDLEDATEIESVSYLGTPYGYKYPFQSPVSFELGGLFRSLYDVRVPNSYYYDTLIYHKTQEEINAVQADA